MKAIPDLAALLQKAKAQDVFGTKMRSVIKSANAKGIAAVVAQQFEIGRKIIAAGLTPIIEPEVDIKAPDKAQAEALLRQQLLAHLNKLGSDELVMFKLTLPEQPDFYKECQAHPNMVRVVALSGGYTRDEANRRLAANHGMIASFSRALTEGLSAQQSDAEFNAMLDSTIQAIFDASCT
jgi:fructose-bisphosphate aldolase class I